MKAVTRYAVIGNPVEHSLSPRIHAAFAAASGEPIEYTTVLAPLDGFTATARAFLDQADVGGANVTVPFKEQALVLCTTLDPLATRAGAVNTLARQADGSLRGYNTDGLGLVADLRRQGVSLAGARLGIVGAGGAARGVVQPLLDAGVAELWLANRTLARAEAIVHHHGTATLHACALDALPDSLDVLINATSAGLRGAPPALPPGVAQGAFCYDMFYAREPTAFCRWAADRGARACSDGLGMLVEQAAEAFAVWRGIRPETTTVLEMLKA